MSFVCDFIIIDVLPELTLADFSPAEDGSNWEELE
jgi:hypothetical protein